MALPVFHIMRSKVAFCEENTVLRKVAQRMISESMGSILVKRGEETVGIITTNDLVRAALKTLDYDKTEAKDIMSHPLEICDSHQDLDEALKLFDKTGRTRLVVKQGDKVIGILKKSVAERFKGVSGVYKFSPGTRSLPFRRG